MKQTAEKKKNALQQKCGRTEKPSCGTLAYLAECRGMIRRAAVLRNAAPPESTKTSRSYFAER